MGNHIGIPCEHHKCFTAISPYRKKLIGLPETWDPKFNYPCTYHSEEVHGMGSVWHGKYSWGSHLCVLVGPPFLRHETLNLFINWLGWKAHREHKKGCIKTSTITISIHFSLQVFSQSGFLYRDCFQLSSSCFQPGPGSDAQSNQLLIHFNSIPQASPGSLLCTVLHLAIGFFPNEAKSNLCEHSASRACSLQQNMDCP